MGALLRQHKNAAEQKHCSGDVGSPTVREKFGPIFFLMQGSVSEKKKEERGRKRSVKGGDERGERRDRGKQSILLG